MKNDIETFNFSHCIRIMNGFAKILVIEHSFVLSEKSIYGAGTTRYKNAALITYTNSTDEEHVILSTSNQNKQNSFDLDSDLCLEKQAELLIINAIEDRLLDSCGSPPNCDCC